MNNTQIIELLAGAIAALSSAVAIIYRESSQRAREYADEWRKAYQEQQKIADDSVRAQEQMAGSMGSLLKNQEQMTDMVRDLWYRQAPDEGRGGARNVR